MREFENEYPHLTEFMDKALHQEAAPTMEEAIAAYAVNGPAAVGKVLSDINKILAENLSSDKLLGYIDRDSYYSEPEGANATLNLVRSVLIASLCS